MQPSHAGGGLVPSGRVVYDGKRMRKAITRRTVDHCASIMKYLEDRVTGFGLRHRPWSSLQPNPANIINVQMLLRYGLDLTHEHMLFFSPSPVATTSNGLSRITLECGDYQIHPFVIE